MNIRRLWVKLALLFLLSAAIGFAVPATLAYITAQSDTVINTFEAPYFPPERTSVEVGVQKTVYSTVEEQMGPEGFRFKLENTSTHETVVLTTGMSGYASVALPFSDADLGKTHTYHLYEINDGLENVTYSDRVYTIEISLSVNAQNQIVAAACVDGKPVQQVIAAFENIYNPGMILPPTGDDTPVALYAVMMLLSSAGCVLLLRKRSKQAIG